MPKNDVLNVFHTLARSQGFYGRLLNAIGYDGENVGDDFWNQFKDCKDSLDVVMAIEC